MSMASLSASLLTRSRPERTPHGGRHKTTGKRNGELFLVPAKTAPTPPPKPVTALPANTANKPERQQKTLRLAREKHRALRALAKQRGVSQQSLMEDAVVKMLEEEAVKSAAGEPRH
ncbi:hypothetical protein [Kordiimonas aestuarii]|uniref:hypothetical protein n=1 Tax=Kordiimonas aestuarii TaxID=1005925 RepID=UPI0021CE9057|nr:hypothetical protein [Kordiimonas aestuarii]